MSSSINDESDSFYPEDEMNHRIKEKHKKNKPRCKFSPQEDIILRDAVQRLGVERWSDVASCLKNRSQRQCRDRWNNYLSPNANLSQWTAEEDSILMRLVALYGNKWSNIAHSMPGRTCSSIRNRFFRLKRSTRNAVTAESTDLTIGQYQLLVYQAPPSISPQTPVQASNNKTRVPSKVKEERTPKNKKTELPPISNFLSSSHT